MIKFENFSYSFPKKDLYNKISFTLESGQHCAFIGTSGSGKSTLIDIIMNPEPYMYNGTLEIDSFCKIGYVSQFAPIQKESNITVFDYIAKPFVELQDKIATICEEMGTSDDLEALLEKYQDALDEFESLDGDNFESNINKKLNLAQLEKHKNKFITDLSGGEFKLIQVIKEMLNNPDLIIMDEPDVFLDFENLNSLKNLINSHKKTLLVVTHNRYLLNHCFNKIIHLENMDLQEFDGRYIDYNLSLLQTKIELQELAVADDEEIARNEVLIDMLREKATYNAEASRGRALKARVKIQERLEARRIKAPFVEIKKPYIDLRTINKPEKEIAIKAENLTLGFDDILLDNINFEISSTDKVAIIGANGVGKTTLLKEIFKNNNDSITISEDTQLAYLSQIQSEVIKESNTILQEFYDIGFETYGEIRRYVGKYGFSSDILTQRIESLSGGEKNILQLAKVSASKSNMLLMDEPTSHLDLYSQIALEEAVKKYDGGILMISHDFDFIINSMDYILLIENKSIRKMTLKKFKRMVYSNHFNRDYFELEQNKKSLEIDISTALANTDFERAQVLCDKLEGIIKLL